MDPRNPPEIEDAEYSLRSWFIGKLLLGIHYAKKILPTKSNYHLQKSQEVTAPKIQSDKDEDTHKAAALPDIELQAAERKTLDE